MAVQTQHGELALNLGALLLVPMEDVAATEETVTTIMQTLKYTSTCLVVNDTEDN